MKAPRSFSCAAGIPPPSCSPHLPPPDRVTDGDTNRTEYRRGLPTETTTGKYTGQGCQRKSQRRTKAEKRQRNRGTLSYFIRLVCVVYSSHETVLSTHLDILVLSGGTDERTKIPTRKIHRKGLPTEMPTWTKEQKRYRTTASGYHREWRA